MFFIFSKIFYFFITPVAWILIGMAITLFCFYKRKSIKIPLIATIVLFVVFTNQALFSFVISKWETTAYPVDSVQNTYKYAVVLGGMASQNPENGKLHISISIDRLLTAIALHKQGKVEKILITGGSGNIFNTNKKEAPELVDFCIQMGVPVTDIITEINSRNTYENAVFTKDIIGTRDSIILVTSAFHMPRSKACFVKQGFNFDIIATDPLSKVVLHVDDYLTPKAEPLFSWAQLIKEWVGIIAYKLAGYI